MLNRETLINRRNRKIGKLESRLDKLKSKKPNKAAKLSKKIENLSKKEISIRSSKLLSFKDMIRWGLFKPRYDFEGNRTEGRSWQELAVESRERKGFSK